jgi:hypothetical protein
MLPLVGPIASSRRKLQNVMRFPPEIYSNHILQVCIKIYLLQWAYNWVHLYKIQDNVPFPHIARWTYSILLERKLRHLHWAMCQTLQQDYKYSHLEKFPLDENTGLAILCVHSISCDCGNGCHALRKNTMRMYMTYAFFPEGHVSPIWTEQWMWQTNNLENTSAVRVFTVKIIWVTYWKMWLAAIYNTVTSNKFGSSKSIMGFQLLAHFNSLYLFHLPS